MAKVAKEVALQEFEGWLQFKRIKDKKRADNQSMEDIIIEAICEGDVIISENKEMVFTLPEPLTSDEGKIVLEKLVFKPRIRVHELNAKLKGVKPDDPDGRVLAYVSAATGQNSGLISRLYTEDFSICQAIVMYFL